MTRLVEVGSSGRIFLIEISIWSSGFSRGGGKGPLRMAKASSAACRSRGVAPRVENIPRSFDPADICIK